MGYYQAVEGVQWQAYIGRKRNNVTHTGNVRLIYLGYQT